jgi:hypothetical protein
MKSTMKVGVTATLAAIAAMSVGAAHAQNKINVQQQVVTAINADPQRKAAILRLINLPGGDWNVTAVKITRLKASNMQFQMPPSKLEAITSTEIVNCDSTETSRDITLSKTVENSTTVTKSETFGVGVEATVSADTFFGGASVTASSNYSMTNESSETRSQSQTISDSIRVGFSDKGGRLSVLQASRIQGNKIPWTATFVPDDNDMIEITAVSRGGRACIYQHHNYGGKSRCFDAGAEVSNVGKDWNDEMTSIRIEGPVNVTIFEHSNWGGRNANYTSSTPNVGKGWNDKLTGIKVLNNAGGGSVRFAALKPNLPPSVQSFTVRGAIDISQTAVDGKRIINYPLTPQELEAACARPPTTTVMAKSTTAGAAGPRAAAMQAGGKESLRVRELSEQETAAKLAGRRPM